MIGAWYGIPALNLSGCLSNVGQIADISIDNNPLDLIQLSPVNKLFFDKQEGR